MVEKDVNLVEALACRDFLEAHGVVVLMSRTKDENDSLIEEIRECNVFNPDLAIDFITTLVVAMGLRHIITLKVVQVKFSPRILKQKLK